MILKNACLATLNFDIALEWCFIKKIMKSEITVKFLSMGAAHLRCAQLFEDVLTHCAFMTKKIIKKGMT